MRLIAIKNLRNEAYQYTDTKKAVEAWYLVMKNSDWSSLEDVRRVYPESIWSARCRGNAQGD